MTEAPQRAACDVEMLGEFPVDSLSPIPKCVVQALTPFYGTDASLQGMGALATVAASLGKGWTCNGAVRDEVTHGNLYVVAAAPTAYGKAILNRVARPILAASQEMEEHWRRTIRPELRVELRLQERLLKKLLADVDLSYPTMWSLRIKYRVIHYLRQPSVPLITRTDALAAQRNLEQIEEQLERTPTYWLGNTTTAAMVAAAARNDGTLFSYSPDAGDLVRIALGKYTRDSSADFDFLLKSFSVERYRESRIVRGDKSIEPCLSLLWACQPFILRELLLNEEAHQRGLTARMLIAEMHDHHVPSDAETPPELAIAEQNWDRLLRRILAKRGEERREIQVTNAARSVFCRFHEEALALGQSYPEALGQLKRWREQAIRIGVGLVVADTVTDEQPNELTMTEMQALRAVELARWCCRSTLHQLCVGRREQRHQVAQRLRSLVRQNGAELRLRDLRDRHGIDPRVVEAAVAEPGSGLEIATNRPPTGRPSQVVRELRP